MTHVVDDHTGEDRSDDPLHRPDITILSTEIGEKSDASHVRV
jgi:hypothetical protein